MTASAMETAVAVRPGRYLAGVEIRILGPLEVVSDGGVQPLGGKRERALLAVMALSPGQVLSADRLIDALWGEALPANPANALQALVSRLRRSLGSDLIVTRSPGYVLAVEPEAVDVAQFRVTMDAAASEADPVERSRRYRKALALWRGAALSDFAADDFAQRDIASLEELRLLAIEERVAADLEAGGGAELVPEIEELVAAHPLRERLREFQMLALYRAGRQAEALRAYTAARRVLGEELGIEPGPELRAMEQAILMQAPALGAEPRHSSGSGGPPVRLPARLASFVGRRGEMAEITAAFDTTRLVTLTGPGGAGKTSLAIEVARELSPRYGDGRWLVELGPLAEATRVPDAMLAALELELGATLPGGSEADPLATVVEYLRSRRALLVVDNCEHLIDAAVAALEEVLLACPDVDVLATSRDRLGIPGELLWRVPPLAVKSGDGWSDAVTLFVERAQAVNPTFDPDDEELALVATICDRVDGLPLAIELAAARSRVLALAEIVERLESGLGVLAGGSRRTAERHQTLRATIDWSYELLERRDQELYARLSAFSGSFTLAAAEAVAPDGWTPAEVLDSVERLLDASIVTHVGGGVRRYRLLETLRVYAGERLAESDEFDVVMQRLLDYFSVSLADAEDELRGLGQLARLEQIELDQATVRSVLDWSLGHAAADGLRLAGMLGWFWYLRGAGAEARERLAALLEAADDDVDVRWRAHAEFFLSLHDSRPDRARAGFVSAQHGYEQAGDVRGVAHCLAMIAAWGFDREETQRLIEQATTLCLEANYDWGVALVRFLQAGAAAVADDIGASARLAEDAAERFAELGDRWGQGYSLYTLGVARRAAGDYAGAEAALLAALQHARPMRLRREMAPVMAELASIATMQGDYDRAAGALSQAREYADDVPFAGSQGMVRNAQGRLSRVRGDLAEAQRLHREAVALYERDENPAGLAYSHSCLGFTEEELGEMDVAREHHRQALRCATRTGDVFALALGLEGIGATLVASGEPARGVALMWAGMAARQRIGTPLPSGERRDVDRALAAAAGVLDAHEFESAVQAGRQMDVDAAAALAQED